MNYDNIIQYIFTKEQQCYENRESSSRKRELVEARQMCMILGESILKLKAAELTAPFKKDRTTFYHAKKHISHLCETDRFFKAKFTEYESQLKSTDLVDRSKKPDSFCECFLFSNSKESLQTKNGIYYSHNEVCELLRIFKETLLNPTNHDTDTQKEA